MSDFNDPIQAYLGRLTAAGYGMDSALVHDILADAEDHLRNAVRDGVSPQAAIEAFGPPEDVVRAYVQAERTGRPSPVQPPSMPPPISSPSAPVSDFNPMPPTPSPAGVPGGATVVVPPPARRSWLACIPVIGIWFDCHAWGSLLFFIIGLAPAVFYFAVMVAGISLGLSMSPLILGLPILVLMLGIARALALFHGQMIERMTGVRMPRRYAAPVATAQNTFWRRIRLWLTDGRSWLSAAFLVGNFPVAIFLFCLFVTLATAGFATMLVPVAGYFSDTIVQAGPGTQVNIAFWHLTPDANGYVHVPPEAAAFCAIAGLLVATLTLYLARGIGWLYAQAAKAIQVTRPGLA